MLPSSEMETDFNRNHRERVASRKKTFATNTISGLLILSLVLIVTSLAIPEIRLRQYVNELRSGGARVVTVYEPPAWLETLTGNQFPLHAKVVGIDFSHYPATDRILESISNWSTLEFVELLDAKISEKALSSLLACCPQMRQMQIVSCPKISPAFIQKMRLQYPALEISYRGVAYLGVAGKAHPQGCEIYYLDTGMPADLAGVKQGDILATFDSQPIKSFEQLIHIIGEHLPGDEVNLRVIRKDQDLFLRCILTDWQDKLR